MPGDDLVEHGVLGVSRVDRPHDRLRIAAFLLAPLIEHLALLLPVVRTYLGKVVPYVALVDALRPVLENAGRLVSPASFRYFRVSNGR